MIISASRRTDIPAYYADWFIEKIRQGACQVKNPFNAKIETVDLSPGVVDGIVFWSRNYRPMLDNLTTLSSLGYRFYCQFTILGYPDYLDPGSPPIEKAAATAQALASRYGPNSVVWRYDPIILTGHTTEAWHDENFANLLDLLAPFTKSCVLSFVDRYKKMERNFYRLLADKGIEILNPPVDELAAMAVRYADQAKKKGVEVSLCCEPEFEKLTGLPAAACVDAGLFGHDVAAVKGPPRKGCACHRSKDIGAYDTCAAGCAYCYATRSREKGRAMVAAIDSASPFLGL